VNEAEVVFGVMLECAGGLFYKHMRYGGIEFSLTLLFEGVVEIEGGVNTPKWGALVIIYVLKLFKL